MKLPVFLLDFRIMAFYVKNMLCYNYTYKYIVEFWRQVNTHIQGDRKKHRQPLICCSGRQTDHYSRRNPCTETHGVGAVDHQSVRSTYRQ